MIVGGSNTYVHVTFELGDGISLASLRCSHGGTVTSEHGSLVGPSLEHDNILIEACRWYDVITDQSSGRAAKSRLVFLYHAIPDKGCFHRPFISFNAFSCVSSPLVTVSFKWLSCAFMISSAVFPWSWRSHGPPNCLHVIVFISLASFHGTRPSTRTS